MRYSNTPGIIQIEYTETICNARTEYEAAQAATRCADHHALYGTAYSGARIVWCDAAVAVRAGVAVCRIRSSSDMTCSDYASVIALRCQVSYKKHAHAWRYCIPHVL